MRHRQDRTRRAGRTSATAALAVLLGVLSAATCLAADPPREKVIEKGGARLYPVSKRVEIDGKFCLQEGPIELFACAKGGKEYESVISLDVNPEMLHFCLLMMRLKPGKPGTGPRFQGDPDRRPTGSPVTVKVKWRVGKVEEVHRAEDLCWNAIDKRTMLRTPWVFVGSKIHKDPDTGKKIYWANVEKSIITVYWDPFAVLDLPLALGANDEAYVVTKQLVPKRGTPCTVILEPAPPLKVKPTKNAAGGTIFHVDVTKGGRTLINNVEPEDAGKALEKTAKQAPKDSCRVTVDHGAPPQAIAGAFAAIDAAGIQIESVQMERVRADVTDAITVAVDKSGIGVRGKTLSDDEAKVVIQSLVKPPRRSGVEVKVAKGASLKSVVRAVRACQGAKGAVVRIVWFATGPPAKQGK